EKVRTYNYPQSRITEHRTGISYHNFQAILDGELDEIMDSIIAYYQSEALKEMDNDGKAPANEALG
ncbi:MAG TPA: hypothetical protein VII00_07815, partial [bacterium]